jgi:biotin carboxyl carrier protein
MYTIKLEDKKFNVELDKKDKSKAIVNNKKIDLDIINVKENTYHVISNNKSYNVEIIAFDKQKKEVDIKLNGVIYKTTVLEDLDLLLKELGMDAALSIKVNDIKAPMPGLVLDIVVKLGQEVNEGDSILILEAMKMENNIKSPTTGVIKEIKCKKGIAVEKNEVLVLFE